MIQIYLAGPYSDEDKNIRKQRYDLLNQMAGFIMKRGFTVYSPISHGHPIANKVNLPGGYGEFWKKHCITALECCEVLAVYTLPGWSNSEGVIDEIETAKWDGKPVIYFNNIVQFEDKIKEVI